MDNKIDGMLLKMLQQGEIDISTFRFYARLIHLAHSSILTGKRTINLDAIGMKEEERCIKKRIVGEKNCGE